MPTLPLANMVSAWYRHRLLSKFLVSEYLSLGVSRSRSRTSFVSRLTFENRRECPSCQFNSYFFLVEIFKIKTFQSRLGCVEILIEIVKTNRDYRDKSRFIEISRDLSRGFERFLLIDNCGRSHPSTDVY